MKEDFAVRPAGAKELAIQAYGAKACAGKGEAKPGDDYWLGCTIRIMPGRRTATSPL